MIEIKYKIFCLLLTTCILLLQQFSSGAYISLESKLLQEYSLHKRHHSPRFKIKYLSMTNDDSSDNNSSSINFITTTASPSTINNNNNNDKNEQQQLDSVNNDEGTSTFNNNNDKSTSSSNSNNKSSEESKESEESQGNRTPKLNIQENDNEGTNNSDKPSLMDDESYLMDAPQVTGTGDVSKVQLGEKCDNVRRLCTGDFVQCRDGVCQCQDKYIPVKSQSQPPNNCEEYYVADVPLRGSCNRTHRCSGYFTQCRDETCSCIKGYTVSASERDICRERIQIHMEGPKTDPTMIGVIVGLALMSVTLCVVMRLFAKARFRENRTIFNTANPRLMNVSLKKVKKKISRADSQAQGPHRGSQDSVAIQSTDGIRQSATNSNRTNEQTYNLARQENLILSTSIDEEPIQTSSIGLVRNGTTIIA